MIPDQDLSRPPSLDELLTGNPVALFLDFDGTLVDIAPTPDSIDVPSGLGASLERLSENIAGRLAIVSGRSIADLQRHLGAIRLARAGSHGIERVNAEGEPIGAPPQPLPLAVLEDLGAFARSREGLGFENKRFGAALHFRSRPDLEREATDTARKIAGDAGLALKPGSCVIEVVQPGASKSGAVHAFMQLPPFRDATPVFVGDDLTDEDGFRAVGDLGGFGILVGDREDTRARYRLDKPACVRDWLSL